MLNLNAVLKRSASAVAVCMLLGAASLQAAADQITVGVPTSTAGSLAFVAAHKGIFKKHGLDVEVKLTPNANATIAALVAGGMQVSAPTASAVLQAAEQGLELSVLAGGSYVSKESQEPSVLVASGSPINSAKDLEGKRISVPAVNSFLDITFKKWMAENGGDPSKVIFVENALPMAVDLLKSGQVDAIISVYPFIGMALGQKVGRVLSAYAAEIGDDPHAAWFTASRAWVEANPEQAKAVRDALVEAGELVAKDSSALLEANIAFLPIPAEVQKKQPLARYRASATADDVQWWNDVLLGQGLISSPVDPKAVLFP